MNNEKIEPGKYVEIAYDLFDFDPATGGETLMHQVDADNPEKIVYGVTPGVIVPLMEAIDGLHQGDHFEAIVTPAEGFGDYRDDLLRTEDLPRRIFEQDGKLNEDHIHPGAEIYLQTNHHQEVKAIVLEVGKETVKVKVDFNHPMAGRTLKIKGTIVKVRPATAEEVAANEAHACGCGCGKEGCGDGNCGDGGSCGCDGCDK